MDFLGSKAPFVLVWAQPWYIPLLWANTKDASISCPLCCCLGKFWPHFPFVTDHFTKIPFYRGWWNGKASHESRIIRHPFKKFIPSGVLEIYIAVRKSHPYIENPFRKNNLVPNIFAMLFLFAFLALSMLGWLIMDYWLCRHSVSDQCNFWSTPPRTETFSLTWD